MFRNGRTVSEETNEIFEQRKAAYQRQKPTTEERKKWNRRIARSCRKDYRQWVSRWTERIEKADKIGDVKEIYRGVKAVSGSKNAFCTTQSTKRKNVSLIQNPAELPTIWSEFLRGNFRSTDLERKRKKFDQLPKCEDESEKVTRAEFDSAVKKMKINKSTGLDGVPAEVWKNSRVANDKLFLFLERVWNKECVPTIWRSEYL